MTGRRGASWWRRTGARRGRWRTRFGGAARKMCTWVCRPKSRKAGTLRGDMRRSRRKSWRLDRRCTPGHCACTDLTLAGLGPTDQDDDAPAAWSSRNRSRAARTRCAAPASPSSNPRRAPARRPHLRRRRDASSRIESTNHLAVGFAKLYPTTAASAIVLYGPLDEGGRGGSRDRRTARSDPEITLGVVHETGRTITKKQQGMIAAAK
mmetsp:Transcript_17776/g.54331  ORF Transcript_17776/g.54331 Transcript_17776/m.54331 type:complete len:208 (+) Transcript_17776:254-877(+)